MMNNIMLSNAGIPLAGTQIDRVYVLIHSYAPV